MDPMQKLAVALSSEPQSKLAKAFSELSVEELGAVFLSEKRANMMHPGHPAMMAAATTKLQGKTKKSSAIPSEEELAEAAKAWGIEDARMEKTSAGLATPALKMMSSAGKGIGSIMKNTATRNAAMGAGAGAALGAAKGAVSNNPNSSALGGAMRGAAMGGAVGLGAKEGLKAMGGMQNRVGALTRGAARRGGTTL